MKKKYELRNEVNHDFTSNNYYVYVMEDPDTAVPFYVGKGIDDRAWRHISLRNNAKIHKTNPHKINTINKIIKGGGKIVIRIVSSCSTEGEAFNDEQLLISVYGRVCNNTGILTNITAGGDGYTHDGIPVCQYTMWGEYVATYKNAKEAMRINGWKTYSCISGCCTGKERSYKGFLWAYEGKSPVLLTTVTPVYQWTLSGDLVQVHRNASRAANAMACDPSTILDCANGHTRLAVGFMWSRSDVAPTLRASQRIKRPVIHSNTNAVYESVTAAAKATRHGIGDVSACCNGRRKQIAGDSFHYVDDADQC